MSGLSTDKIKYSIQCSLDAFTVDDIMSELEGVTDNDMSEVSTEFTPNITSTPISVRSQNEFANKRGSTNTKALTSSIEKEVRRSTRIRSRPGYLDDYIYHLNKLCDELRGRERVLLQS